MTKIVPKTKFVLCIADKDCDDLEKGKVYPIVPDDSAAKEGYVKAVDDSEEDYLYPEAYFVSVELPQEAQAALSEKGNDTICGGAGRDTLIGNDRDDRISPFARGRLGGCRGRLGKADGSILALHIKQ